MGQRVRAEVVTGVYVTLEGRESCAIFPIGECSVGRGVMASVQRQPVTIHYRRLEDATGAFGKHSLESAIRNAMRFVSVMGEKISARWQHRAYLIPPSAEDTLLMNLHHDGGDHFFGDLTQYTKGYMQTRLSWSRLQTNRCLP